MLNPLVSNAAVMRNIGVFGVDDSRGWAMGRKFLGLLKEMRVKDLYLETVWEKRSHEASQGRAEINFCDRFWYGWWDRRFRYVKIMVSYWGVDEEGLEKEVETARACAGRLVGEGSEVVVGARKQSLYDYGNVRWEKSVVVKRKT
jgi:hypothetical protein